LSGCPEAFLVLEAIMLGVPQFGWKRPTPRPALIS
jgi:hypothetical protein